jgi:pectate lyase
MAVLNGSGSAEALITADGTTGTDYAVTMDASVVSGQNEEGVVVRFVDASNYYWLGIGSWGHQFSIGRMLNGVAAELASSGSSSSIVLGQSYNINAVAQGSTLTLFVNGVQELQITDSSFSSGEFGIRAYGSSIQVTNISASSLIPSKGNNTAVIVLLAIGAVLALS